MQHFPFPACKETHSTQLVPPVTNLMQDGRCVLLVLLGIVPPVDGRRGLAMREARNILRFRTILCSANVKNRHFQPEWL